MFTAGANDVARDLVDIGAEYLQLIGADRQNENSLLENRFAKWTGIVSTEHYAIAGCVENMLEDDLTDAWEEIEHVLQGGTAPWQFVFNAKDHELPATANDLDEFKLSANDLELLGKQVTRLRKQVSERVE